MFRKILLGLVALIVIAAAWLVVLPPDLIRVGANYSAKMICSNLVLAGRDPDEVLRVDVQAPGHPLLRLMRFSVDERGDMTVVRAGLFGFIGKGLAFGNSERGCTVVPDARYLGIAAEQPSFVKPQVALGDALWPVGNIVEPQESTALEAVLNNPEMIGEGMRAVVIVKDGAIIAERYGEGFDENTPLLGWSMAKTVTAALVGAASKDGLLSLEGKPDFDGWAGDERTDIELSDLMGMASDLEWNEGYGSVSDVTRMLYLTLDGAELVASKPIDAESTATTGENFLYSSGSTVLISRHLQNQFADKQDAAAYPSKALFEPLGMQSAVMETDASGTFVGSSYVYATARDWARFGQLLLQRGVWQGDPVLPAGFVDFMTDAHPASNGLYGRGQLWLAPPREHRERTSDLPEDTFWASGHDGQSIAVVPSQNLVVVRLGLTPWKLNYRPGRLVEAVIAATKQE